MQAVGTGEVAKRVDVATQLIARGGDPRTTWRRWSTPTPRPYAPAVDPLALVAWTAQNQEDGVEAEPPTVELEDVVDVRLPEEREARPADARQVEPLSLVELRDGQSVRSAPRGLVVCERGARSAEAVRLLQDRGQPRYLGGGLQWRDAARSRDPKRASGAPAGADGATREPATRVRD